MIEKKQDQATVNPMNLHIDNEKQEIKLEDGTVVPLYSKEGFRIISDIWVKVGWDQKHLYGFSWLGRPIIQIPDDMVRMQEVIYEVQPDVIIETGIAHGGSLIFSASLCRAMGKGKVVAIDIDIREHNRKPIEEHILADLITMYEGSSIDQGNVDKIASHVKDGDKVIAILDSCHDYDHVLRELEMYSHLINVGSYIVATDGSQEYLHDVARAKVDYAGLSDGWHQNNPKRAAEDFVAANPNFEIVEPTFPFNEGPIDFRITHWPSAFVKRIR